jgi:catechol 2,3-dioxygenase-like lactoylglutathione lyase family enzyme
MLDHVSIGVRDIARTKRFYDLALAPLGYKCLRDTASLIGYGAASIEFWITPTQRPVSPEPESGLHFCFLAPGPEAVEAFHRAAVAAGGRDNGAPGLRPEYSPGYFAAFVTDPDGYRIEAYCR